MRLVFEDQAWEDYTSWLRTDRFGEMIEGDGCDGESRGRALVQVPPGGDEQPGLNLPRDPNREVGSGCIVDWNHDHAGKHTAEKTSDPLGGG